MSTLSYEQHRALLLATAESCERAAESCRLRYDFARAKNFTDIAIRYRWLAEPDPDVEALFKRGST